jgi:cytochrome c peroxidase
MRTILAAAAAALAASAADADPAGLLAAYQVQARKADAAFSASASRGEQFFNARHGNDWSCASCHGAPPTGQGKHAKTGKLIAPLAPAANAERFTEEAKAEKWFRRNCNDVLSRACTPAEKADVVAYLLGARP